MADKKHINEMTRREFKALPYRAEWNVDVECQSIVILPMRRMHDSGYRVMDFVAVVNGKLFAVYLDAVMCFTLMGSADMGIGTQILEFLNPFLPLGGR